MVHDCNPNSEAKGSKVRAQFGQFSYFVKPCLKILKIKKKAEDVAYGEGLGSILSTPNTFVSKKFCVAKTS